MNSTRRFLFTFSLLALFALVFPAVSSAQLPPSTPLYDAQCYPTMTDTEGMNPFDKLWAVEEIKKTKARYFRCMDNKDWDCFQDTMTEDVDFNVLGALYAVDEQGNILKSGDVTITQELLNDPVFQAAWQINGNINVALWEFFALQGAQTMHQGHMPEVTLVTPETAVACVTLTHHLRFPMANPFANDPFLGLFMPTDVPHPELFGYGFYREEYEKGADGVWRISHLRFHTFRVEISYKR